MSTALRFTLEEYDRMIEQGVFDESRDRRIELIYGELREMTPPGPSHEETVDVLNEWSVLNVPRNEVRVRVQNSIGIAGLESAPEPDLSWVRRKSYRTGRPRSSDVLLLIEVSDSSLDYDCGEKAGLYAQADIQDYWVVNLRNWCVEVFRKPEGEYRERFVVEMDRTVSPLAFPDLSLSVAFVFGQSE